MYVFYFRCHSGSGLPGTNGQGSSGAGHGGNGGSGQNQGRVGSAFGNVYEPTDFGCKGGGNGGLGGGKLKVFVNNTLQIDGEISCNGQQGHTSYSGGGSGGSIWISSRTIKGYGSIQVNGGKGYRDTATSRSYHGGGGAGGRLAVYFSRNRTYSGSFEAFGGQAGDSGASIGGPGTIFLYHKEYNHRTLQISNKGIGKVLDSHQIIHNFKKYNEDPSKAWIITDSKHALAKNLNYHFEELQLYGDAHLAFLPKSENNSVSIFFRHMIGDRTGTLHLAGNQTMDLKRHEIDLPFTLRIYPGGHAGLAPMTFVHGVKIYNYGLITHMQNITLHHNGELHFYEGSRAGNKSFPDDYSFNTVRVQSGGLVRFWSSPVTHTGMNLSTELLHIEGGGKLLASDIRVLSEDVIIDAAGHFSTDGQGFKSVDGTGKWSYFTHPKSHP